MDVFKGLVEIQTVDSPGSILNECAAMLEGATWWLGFGTALGLYRDGDFIPHDTDFDICILGEYDTSAFEERFSFFRSIQYEGAQHQSAFQDESGLIIDLSFYYEKDDILYSVHDQETWIDRKDVVLPTQNVGTQYGILPFPSDIEGYLEARYANWRVPSNDKSIVNAL